MLIERFWPAGERAVRPPMPLRRGYLAVLIAAGFLNNILLETVEPPRECWRLQFLRGWSYGTTGTVSSGDAGAGATPGPGARGGVPLPWATITSIAQKCGMTPETLRQWVRAAEADAGGKPRAATNDECARLRELEREHRELRRANQILKAVLRRLLELGQYLSIRYTERLAEAGLVTSVGSRGDSYDNALAESVIGLCKTELVHARGPWRGLDDLELATLEWVDWFNHRRLLGPIGYLPPAEYERSRYPERPQPVAGIA